MKLAIFLPVFLAFFCLNQIHCEFLNLVVESQNQTSVKGTISVFLKGYEHGKKFVFYETHFSEKQLIEKHVFFHDRVKEVVVNWETKTSEPIYLFNLTILGDYRSILAFVPMNTYIENGKPKKFILEKKSF